jgi:hypothetical protein
MEGSGIWALDLDVPSPDHAADGVAAFKALVEEHGQVPPRPTMRTGGGGLVLFFKHNGEPIGGKTGTPCPGIDPRRGRLAVTVPPSPHVRTGLAYRWIIRPWDLDPPPAPGWLLRLVAPPVREPLPEPRAIPATGGKRRGYAVAALQHATSRVAQAQAGTRNATLNAETWAMRRFISQGLLDMGEVAEALAHAGRLAGLDLPEVALTVKSALRAGSRP